MKTALRIAAALSISLLPAVLVLLAVSLREAATGLFDPRPTPPVRTHRVIRSAPRPGALGAGAILDSLAGRRDGSGAFLVDGPLPVQIDASSGSHSEPPIRVLAAARVYPIEYFPCTSCDGGGEGRPLAPGQEPLAVGYSPVFEVGRAQSMRVPTYIPLPELPPGEYLLVLEARLRELEDLSAPEIPPDREPPRELRDLPFAVSGHDWYATYSSSKHRIRVPARPAARSIFGL